MITELIDSTTGVINDLTQIVGQICIVTLIFVLFSIFCYISYSWLNHWSVKNDRIRDAHKRQPVRRKIR